jgi:hypothetical protein
MVLDKATEHPNCHIFIDEFPAGEDGFTSEEVSQLDKKVCIRESSSLDCL